MTKPFSLTELEARVAAHLRREARHNTAPQVRFAGELTIDYKERCLFYGNQRITLARKEFDIIEFLSLNAGQVFDRERALAAYTQTAYIETVWGCGYKWVR